MIETTAKISPRERYPSGHPKPVTDAPKGKSPTLVRRIMDHAVKMGSDPRVASVLGRLHLEGILTETECEAGMLYAEDVGRYERAMGHPRRSAKSPAFEVGNGDSSLDLAALERMDPDRAQKLKEKIERRVRKAKKAYGRAQACIPGLPIIASTIIEEVCCNDGPVNSVHHAGLKAILGNLAKQCYQLHVAAEATPATKQRKAKPGDAKLLAEAACDAIAAWFETENNTAQAFAIGTGKHKTRKITVYGVWTRDNKTPVSHEIEVRLRGLMPAVLDAQLVKAAIDKGWNDASKRRMA